MGVPKKALIEKDEIVEYIPQRAPIVMIDEFLGIFDDVAISGLTITEDNFFCECGFFSECGVIEHIAQSAAMRAGYICKSENKEIPLGYIGSVNKFKIYHLPKIGDCLRTEICIEQQVMNISLISASVKIGDTMVAECQMKIYLQE